VYVLYTHDAAIGGTAPRWGTVGATSDGCPNPPGATSDGCVVSARLSRLQAAGNVMTGAEQVLVEDWCQQYPSHSIGSVEFGPDGALYASAGDGASFNFADYGQGGSPLNPCGDPPAGVGGTMAPPTAEGGALRSQDLRSAGDPAGLDGSIIRVDPATGAALPTNPQAGSSDPNVRRIIAYGLRNPFRFTFRPGTSELWIGDVGWNEWEEINRILSPTDATVENFGWPCYEGTPRQSGYDSANLTLCENLYAQPNADTKPYFAYHHSNKVVAGESCATGSSSLSGLSFEFAPLASSFPAAYQGGLFFADYSRDCIWVMKKNGNPIPSPGAIDTFAADAANPVNVEFGPDGNFYYVDFDGGTIRRVSSNSPPAGGTHYLSDLTWTSMTNGWGPAELDLSNGEASEGDGNTLTLNGTTYAKGLGVHANSDVQYAISNCSRFKASVGVDDEVGTEGSVTFEVYADATKVYDSGVMTGVTATKLIDVSIAGASQLRLAVVGGASIDYDHSDWALARIECGGGGGDTTPPTITGQTPAPGATGVALNVSPTATFSEAMNPATITTGTLTLQKQGVPTPVAATVTYAGAVATLDPSADLDPSSVYTATVKGGPSGVKDVAGNELAADVTWSFTTAASDTTPPTVTGRTPAPGATGVALNVSPSATFSEAMDASTLTTSTFTLIKQGTSTPLAATVSYQSASTSVILDPSSSLEPGTGYTATVKGGASGAKDVGGTPLANDISWSFTTAAAANQPPTAVIDTPAASLTWRVGDTVAFSGHASDPEQGTLPASALSWTLLLQHCPSNCHTHTLQSWPGAASGSFPAPDHEYPSYLELKLTATDAGGASTTTTRRLDPQTVVLSFASQPSGLQLAVNSVSSTTPFTRTVIVGSQNSLSATSPQTLSGTSYSFSAWSDGGAQSHNVTAPASASAYTATYNAASAAPANTALPSVSSPVKIGRTATLSNGTWTGSQPITFSYQWLQCTSTSISSCTPIAGATSNSLLLTEAMRGFRLRGTVTASNTAGTAQATSNATSPVK
jgi:glucose/arabinose dehydrogenase